MIFVWTNFLKYIDKKFVDKIAVPVPELLSIFQGKVGLVDLGINDSYIIIEQSLLFSW